MSPNPPGWIRPDKPIRYLADGSRMYAGGERYTPVAPEDRKYGINKPDDPRAVRFHGSWFLPLEVLPDEERSMPLTRPDDQALEHKMLCRCDVCSRPGAVQRKRKALGLRA